MGGFPMNRAFVRQLISMHTQLTSAELVPELTLRLITPDCPLWKATPEQSPFPDPFWAFFWPGGQVLTRYILDNPRLFYKKTILDFGSGCGASALACKMAGASHVVANDIDAVAEVAVGLNMEANGLKVMTDTTDRLSSPLAEHFDLVLMGDMFYDPEFTHTIADWMGRSSPETSFLIGDPGRHSLLNHPIKARLNQIAEYDLPKTCQVENNGFTTGRVWVLSRTLKQ